MNINIEINKAIEGDKKSLEKIIRLVQDDIYYLSLRMLANPDDAKDATQEILIKIITNLSSFKFESKFKTWVYRISANYLLTSKKIIEKSMCLSFEDFKTDLESDLEQSSSLIHDPEYSTMLNELRISCTIAMLLCLTPSTRLAYILGNILEVKQQEGSQILGISKDSYRKKLSRARLKLTEFMKKSCGLVNKQAPCSCEKKLKGAIDRKRVSSSNIYFSNTNNFTYSDLKDRAKKTRQELRTTLLQQSISQYKFPDQFIEIIEALTHITPE